MRKSILKALKTAFKGVANRIVLLALLIALVKFDLVTPDVIEALLPHISG